MYGTACWRVSAVLTRFGAGMRVGVRDVYQLWRNEISSEWNEIVHSVADPQIQKFTSTFVQSGLRRRCRKFLQKSRIEILRERTRADGLSQIWSAGDSL